MNKTLQLIYYTLNEIGLDKNLRATVGDIFQTGSETTSTTLSLAMLYLTVHPKLQAKLQNKIDSVFGNLCKPNLSDRVR